MSEKTYGILYDGNYEKVTGNNIQEIISKKGKKTNTGELDFSLLQAYEVLPSAVLMDLSFGNSEYMVFLMRNKKSNWEPVEKIFNVFSSESGCGAEDFMKLKVKMEGYFSGLVVDMKNEKPISWIWSR